MRDGVRQRESERIARQWNREIDDEIRRETARDPGDGPWKGVAWCALWLLWLALLVALILHIQTLR
jgi:hypothetical protein